MDCCPAKIRHMGSKVCHGEYRFRSELRVDEVEHAGEVADVKSGSPENVAEVKSASSKNFAIKKWALPENVAQVKLTPRENVALSKLTSWENVAEPNEAGPNVAMEKLA
jgi:hypothetical protein